MFTFCFVLQILTSIYITCLHDLHLLLVIDERCNFEKFISQIPINYLIIIFLFCNLFVNIIHCAKQTADNRVMICQIAT